LEAQAVIEILEQTKTGEHELVSSDVLRLEVSKNSDDSKRSLVLKNLNQAVEQYLVRETDRQRGQALEALGFKSVDALHLACAESGKAFAFLTTDDRLLRRARRLQKKLLVRVYNPIQWLIEVSK
jgi:predicted nucleic acid-binding protein